MDQSPENRYRLIAQRRAAQVKAMKQESNFSRARSQDGKPVTYTKMKEKTNIMRNSRVMSDPEIPGTLVILNAKGLFKGKIGNERDQRPESDSFITSVNIMDRSENRPQFFDPSLSNKKSKVHELRKRFEVVESDIMGEKGIGAASNFLNPLHKVNQDLMCENNREKQRDANTKLEDIITFSEPVLHGALNVKESNSMAEISSKGLEDRVEMPMRPPPRAPLHDLKIRSRGESDPMPLDVNQMSRVLALQQDSLHPVIESKQEDNSPRSETEKLENAIDYNKEGEDYDDNASDDDEWDSDFDDEDFDDNDEELKRDSRSSHDSSCDTEPLEFPDAISKKLYNIAMEILTTERAYVRRLRLLDQVFYLQINNQCCAKGLLPQEVLNDIFSNIQAIHQLHKDFLLPKLEERMKKWGTNNQIGDILKGLAPFLKMYTLYVGNFDKATETLASWIKKSPAMATLIEDIQKTEECEHLTLQHHMLEPVQRVPRYKLLLKDYVAKLPEDSRDLKNTSDALKIISASAQHAQGFPFQRKLKSDEREAGGDNLGE